jgi:uncharacterized membrane protein
MNLRPLAAMKAFMLQMALMESLTLTIMLQLLYFTFIFRHLISVIG